MDAIFKLKGNGQQLETGPFKNTPKNGSAQNFHLCTFAQKRTE
jgi:hypothetical protein